MGGFTTYALVVIPMGADQLAPNQLAPGQLGPGQLGADQLGVGVDGSADGAEATGHRAFGFITRRVILWFLALAVVQAAVLWPEWRDRARRAVEPWARRAYLASIVALAALCGLYPWLNSQLDVAARSIPDPDGFYIAHRIYLWTAMVHWLGTVGFAYAVVARWLAPGPASGPGRAPTSAPTDTAHGPAEVKQRPAGSREAT